MPNRFTIVESDEEYMWSVKDRHTDKIVSRKPMVYFRALQSMHRRNDKEKQQNV